MRHHPPALRFLLLISCSMLFLCTAQTLAQGGYDTLPLEDLFRIKVESTSFFETSISRSPGHVTIIDRSTIENSPARSLTGLLSEQIAGLETGWHFLTGSLIGTRGILIDSDAKTLLLVDGYNMNYRKHWGALGAQIDQPFLGYVDHVEVVQGPGNLVHGTGAINGFVNLIPKNGADNPGLSGAAEAGYPTSEGNVQSGYGFSYGDSRDLYLYGGLGYARGYLPRVYTDSSEYAAFNSGHLDSLVHYKGREASRVMTTGDIPRYTLFANWRHGPLHVQGGMYNATSPATIHDYVDWGNPWYCVKNSTMLWAGPKLTVPLGSTESLQLTLNAHMLDALNDYPDRPNDSIQAMAKEGLVLGRAVFRSTRIDFLDISLGGQADRRNFDDGTSYFYGATMYPESVSIEGGDETIWLEAAGFGEAVLTLGRFAASAGVRYDFVRMGEYTDLALGMKNYTMPDNQVSHFSPRFAASFAPTDDNIIKASYQEGFRYPDLQHFASGFVWNYYWEDTTRFSQAGDHLIIDAIRKNYSQGPLPPVEPEIMRSVEANFIHAFSIPVLLTLNCYYNFFEKAIAWSNELMCQRNSSGTFGAAGGEIIADAKPSAAVNLRLSYAASVPVDIDDSINTVISYADTADHDEWYAYSRHQVKFSASESLFGDAVVLSQGLGVYSPKSRYLLSEMNALKSPRLDLGLAARYNFGERHWIQFRAQNILGSLPSSFAGFPSLYYGHSGQEETLFFLTAGTSF